MNLKISHLLGQYLLQNKTLRLQGIGEFTMNNFYDNPFENEKGKVKIPENTIQFSPDKKGGEDAGLIDFIAKSTGKIKPLAASDLEDFLNSGKQLLNVSKQFYIEGLGTLILNSSGGHEFVQGNEVISSAVSEDSKGRNRKEEATGEISFSDGYNKKVSGNPLRNFLIIAGSAAGLIVIALLGYYFIKQWRKEEKSTPEKTALNNIKPVINTPAIIQKDTSTEHKVTDSVAVKSLPPADSAGNTFKVVFETANRERALLRHKNLLNMGLKIMLETEDSVTYKIYTPVKAPLSDTTKIRDSISRYFGRKAYIELK